MTVREETLKSVVSFRSAIMGYKNQVDSIQDPDTKRGVQLHYVAVDHFLFNAIKLIDNGKMFESDHAKQFNKTMVELATQSKAVFNKTLFKNPQPTPENLANLNRLLHEARDALIRTVGTATGVDRILTDDIEPKRKLSFAKDGGELEDRYVVYVQKYYQRFLQGFTPETYPDGTAEIPLEKEFRSFLDEALSNPFIPETEHDMETKSRFRRNNFNYILRTSVLPNAERVDKFEVPLRSGSAMKEIKSQYDDAIEGLNKRINKAYKNARDCDDKICVFLEAEERGNEVTEEVREAIGLLLKQQRKLLANLNTLYIKRHDLVNLREDERNLSSPPKQATVDVSELDKKIAENRKEFLAIRERKRERKAKGEEPDWSVTEEKLREAAQMRVDNDNDNKRIVVLDEECLTLVNERESALSASSTKKMMLSTQANAEQSKEKHGNNNNNTGPLHNRKNSK